MMDWAARMQQVVHATPGQGSKRMSPTPSRRAARPLVGMEAKARH